MEAHQGKKIAFSIPVVLLLTLIWLLIANFSLSSLLIGVPFILMSSYCYQLVRRNLRDPQTGHENHESLKLSLTGTLNFIGYFFLNSILGAWDITKVVFSNTSSLSPAFLDYEMKLHSTRAQLCLAYAENLLPGTLTVAIHKHHLRIHFLQNPELTRRQLEHLERLIARMFKLKLIDQREENQERSSQ